MDIDLIRSINFYDYSHKGQSLLLYSKAYAMKNGQLNFQLTVLKKESAIFTTCLFLHT